MLTKKQDHESPIITFLIGASSMQFLGISGAFWSLLIGCMIDAYQHRKSNLSK